MVKGRTRKTDQDITIIKRIVQQELPKNLGSRSEDFVSHVAFANVGSTVQIPQGGGSGTVTSVDLAMPGVFSVSGNPITTSGTITVSLVSQSANRVWASPDGTSGTPTFRALVGDDLPTFSYTAKGAVPSPGGSGSVRFLREDGSWQVPLLTTPAGADTQVQFNDGGAFGASSLMTFNKTTGFFSAKGLSVNPTFNQISTIVDGSTAFRQPTVFTAFRVLASGTATGPDTGSYVDITTAVNTGTLNLFNGTAALNRVYFGWDSALPRELRALSNSGTLGVGGVVLWEIWNGSAWVTITGTNLLADNTSVTIPTTATFKTVVNSVNAYWIRATVSTAYTTAPVFRFIRSSTASNLPANATPSIYGNGLFIAHSSITQSVLNTIMSSGTGATALITGVTYGNGEQNILQVYSAQSAGTLFTIGGDGTTTATSADNTFRNLTLNGGTSNQSAVLTLVNGAKSQTSWLTSGAFFRSQAGTRTNLSAAGTYATAVFNSFNTPTLAATNAGTITTDAANLYIESAPVQGTNQTITNSWAIWVDAGNVRLDGQLRVDQRVYPGSVVALTDGATIALNASLGNHFRVTLGGNRTLGVPTNAVDGQRILIEVIQDGTGSRTLTLTTGSAGAFAYGTDITTITLSTTAGATDYIGCVYNSTAQRWRVIAFVKGY